METMRETVPYPGLCAIMRFLLAGKPGDPRVQQAMRSIKECLQGKYNDSKVFSLDDEMMVKDMNNFDYGITIGGDGTVLYMNSLFPHDSKPPPILPFSLGSSSLGFLLPFGIDDLESVMDAALSGSLTLMNRDRLQCSLSNNVTLQATALNEVGIGRGGGLRLTRLACSVDGQELTEAVADGVLVATGTGSTAYSLSAGGPVMHPACASLLLTPICPRSLSFRPLVLPVSSALKIKNCGEELVEVSMDGRCAGHLSPGQSISVSRAMHPLQTFARSDHEWMDRVNRLLGWNRSFQGGNNNHIIL